MNLQGSAVETASISLGNTAGKGKSAHQAGFIAEGSLGNDQVLTVFGGHGVLLQRLVQWNPEGIAGMRHAAAENQDGRVKNVQKIRQGNT
jgi:hypothetical protein